MSHGTFMDESWYIHTIENIMFSRCLNCHSLYMGHGTFIHEWMARTWMNGWTNEPFICAIHICQSYAPFICMCQSFVCAIHLCNSYVPSFICASHCMCQHNEWHIWHNEWHIWTTGTYNELHIWLAHMNDGTYELHKWMARMNDWHIQWMAHMTGTYEWLAHMNATYEWHIHEWMDERMCHSYVPVIERCGAGVEYHFQEFNEPYTPL